jgi:hypothetical protein
MKKNKSTGLEIHTVPQAMELFNTKEAAAILGVEPHTLEQWRWRGVGLRFSKIGRGVRYTGEELRKFVAVNTFQSTSESQAAGLM